MTPGILAATHENRFQRFLRRLLRGEARPFMRFVAAGLAGVAEVRIRLMEPVEVA